MTDFIEKIRAKIADKKCSVHNKGAGVSLKKREFDFKVQGCCKVFKAEVYAICQKEKLAYLANEHKKGLR